MTREATFSLWIAEILRVLRLPFFFTSGLSLAYARGTSALRVSMESAIIEFTPALCITPLDFRENLFSLSRDVPASFSFSL